MSDMCPVSFLLKDGGRQGEHMATHGTLLIGCPTGEYTLSINSIY